MDVFGTQCILLNGSVLAHPVQLLTSVEMFITRHRLDGN